MPLTGDSRRGSRGGRDSSRTSGLSTWLSPSGSPRGGTDDVNFSPSSPPTSSVSGNERIPGSAREPSVSPTRTHRGSSVSNGSPALMSRPSMPAPAGRLAFLTTSISTAVSRLTQPTPLSPTTEDEILSMDIERALFPSGAPPETFSPAAFKNLQMAATAVLTKVQAAYRQRSALLHELQDEGGALKDELDESRTRVEHLRLQLEGMARESADREKEMVALKEELDRERRMRVMGEQRLSEVLLVKGVDGEKGLPQLPEGSVISEDLGVEEEQRRQRRWRKSLKSDGSYDSDEEGSLGDAESSVFSRSRSPTIIQGGVYDGNGLAHPRVTALGIHNGPSMPAATGGRLRPLTSPPAQPMTTLQRLYKGVTGRKEDGEQFYRGSGPEGCQNCLGQDSNFAWNTVSLLRDENRELKNRVGELETAVDTAIDLAGGIGLELNREL